MGANYAVYFNTTSDKRLSFLAPIKYPRAKNPKTQLIKDAVEIYLDMIEKEFPEEAAKLHKMLKGER